jgi:peptidoglycan/xylan/chitin deacetylase (PgdA/CDA1 family)
MQIALESSKSTNGDALEKYVFHYLAFRNGWFTNQDFTQSQIVFKFATVNHLSIKHFQKDKILFQLNESLIHRIKIALRCDDSSTPDEEPKPISHPFLDELSFQIHNSICKFCKEENLYFLYKLPWPNGKSIAITLTHDIDLTTKVGFKNFLSELIRGGLFNLKSKSEELRSENSAYWNFDEILSLYKERKLKSTFFFIARSWEKFHYRYNISKPKFRKLFNDILSDGHEIALHTSKFAFDHPARIIKEKNKLEQIIGLPVRGVRQHYLRLRFPEAWQNFEQAKCDYDSSCGYNNGIGFRAGTCFPFPTFSLEYEKQNHLIEFPISIMDYPWIEYENTAKKKWEQFIELFEIIQRFRGIFNILWHPNNLTKPSFRPFWQKMMDWLDNIEFYNATLYQIYEWLSEWENVTLKQHAIRSDNIEIILYSKFAVDNLTLELISPRKLKNKNQEYEVLDLENKTYRLKFKKLKSGVNIFKVGFA